MCLLCHDDNDQTDDQTFLSLVFGHSQHSVLRANQEVVNDHGRSGVISLMFPYIYPPITLHLGTEVIYYGTNYFLVTNKCIKVKTNHANDL